MDSSWNLSAVVGWLVGLSVIVFLFVGSFLGWRSYFEVRRLRRQIDLWRPQEPQTQPSAPEPEVPPSPEPRPAPVPPTPAPVAEVIQTPPPPPSSVNVAPVNLPPRKWEGKFLENWTGILGLVAITLGIGFLGVYAATVMTPFWRFFSLVCLAGAVFVWGQFVLRSRAWARWGGWLQSLAAAVFLFGCLGSGGIEGMTWVSDPLASLVLLLLGVTVNFVMAAVRKQQPFLTFHVVLSLTALSVPDPSLLLLAFLTAAAGIGIGFTWFQRWPYNRAVTAALFQTILVLAHVRLPDPDQITQLAFVAASAALGLLIHLSAYRKADRGVAWSRSAFVSHGVNAIAAAVACALWAPHSPVATLVVLSALVVGLFVLARWARAAGTSWLYRMDRVLAVAVAGILLALHPLAAPPLVLLVGFLLVVLVTAWTARLEKDALLAQLGDVALVLVTAALIPAAFSLNAGAPGEPWLWNLGAAFLGGTAVLLFLLAVSETAGAAVRWAAALTPLVFLSASAELLFQPDLVPGVSIGLFLLVPAALTGWVVRKGSVGPWLAWGWLLQGVLAAVAAWASFAWHQPLAALGPIEVLAWGAPVALLTLLPVVLLKSRQDALFTAAALVALVSFDVLAGAVLGSWFPEGTLAASVIFLGAALVLGFWRDRTDPQLPRYALWAATAVLLVWRLGMAFDPPPGLGVALCDIAAVILLGVLAFHKTWGPSPFWEVALAGAALAMGADLPRDVVPLAVALWAVAALVGSRIHPTRRLVWYATILFLTANVLVLFPQPVWVTVSTLAVLVGYVLADGFLPGRDRVPAQRFHRYLIVFVQAAGLAWALPSILDSRALTFGWSVESFLLFLLAMTWKDPVFKNASFVALAACLARLLLVDLSGSDVLVKALTFLAVGGLMVGMNVLYLRSKRK